MATETPPDSDLMPPPPNPEPDPDPKLKPPEPPDPEAEAADNAIVKKEESPDGKRRKRKRKHSNVGYVYAPYVPLQVTPSLFSDEKGIRTRSNKNLVQMKYYGTITVSGKKTK